MAARERRRPAVSPHPLAAVPAATYARQAPRSVLATAKAGAVVHVLELSGDRARWVPRCRTRSREFELWFSTPPLRLCSLCATAVGGPLGFPWAPTRAELGEMHLHAADQLVAAVRERLADIRSAAIYDGSALIGVEQLPTYRTSRGVPDSEPVPSLRTAVILGQLLERISPDPVVPSAADEAATQARLDALAAERQRMTDRLTAGSSERRLDLRAARAAKKRPR